MAKLELPIPVIIVAGFLGSGKTTLLNRILNGDHGRRIAVMVNDFGAINIDSQLIVSAEQTMVGLANGCICCTMESDLIEQLENLLRLRDGPPESILIETSGVSDPARVVHTLEYPRFREQIGIDAVITLLDAEQFSCLEGDAEQLAMNQLAAADIVIINKIDLASEAQIQQLKKEWLFPGARVYETRFADIPLELLLGVDHFSGPRQSPEAVQCDSPDCDPPAHHNDRLFTTCNWESSQVLSLDKLRKALRQLPTNIYRAKGFVYLEEAPFQRCTVHLVGTRLEIKKSSVWDKERQGNQLVMIGWGHLDANALARTLDSCAS